MPPCDQECIGDVLERGDINLGATRGDECSKARERGHDVPLLVNLDYHARIDDPALGIDERTFLVMRGTGPLGYPGGAEVVNMRPPAVLIHAGVDAPG